MREIKYRAFNKDEKKMCRVVSTDFIDMVTVRFPEFEGSEFGDEYNDKLELSEFEPLIQYTGLKDKNGREIYECDIVELEYDTPYNSGGYRRGMHKAIVKDGADFKYQKSGYYLVFKDFKGRDVERHLSWSDLERIEVVGNIHDNTDLLDEVNND